MNKGLPPWHATTSNNRSPPSSRAGRRVSRPAHADRRPLLPDRAARPDRHGADLFAAYQAAADGRDWTYLSADRHDTLADHAESSPSKPRRSIPLHYAILEAVGGKAVGTVALMRIDPSNGVIEIGHITFAPALQRTAAATEAVALLMVG